MEIQNFLGEKRQFVVVASSKEEAMEKAKQNIEVMTFIFCNHTSLRVVKKMKGDV